MAGARARGTPSPPRPMVGTTFSTDAACARRFVDHGGYGEMSVTGQSSECQHIDDGGQPYVFNRVTYRPTRCSMSPSLPECVHCGNGGAGMF